jgi:hypothetical protein
MSVHSRIGMYGNHMFTHDVDLPFKQFQWIIRLLIHWLNSVGNTARHLLNTIANFTQVVAIVGYLNTTTFHFLQ